MKKTNILLFGAITFVLISMMLVSAANFDNIQNIKETYGKAGYKDIEIQNAFGFGDILWSGTLDSNTNECYINCEATQTITLHEPGVLIEEVIFKTLQPDGSWKEQPIRNHQIYANGNLYQEGTEMDAGTYEVKLVGEKKPSRTVDWIYKTQGETLDEWAIWGGLNLTAIDYFNFNEGSGTTAEDIGTPGGNDMTVQTDAWDSQGKDGSAFLGDGNNGLETSINLGTDHGPNQAITVSLWVNMSASFGSGATLFGTAIATNNGKFTLETNTASRFAFLLHDGAGATQTFVTVPVLSEWFMVTLAINSSSYFMYYNNTLVASGSLSSFVFDEELFNFAERDGGTEGFDNGAMDEFKIFNSVLNQSDVDFLYNDGDGIFFNGEASSITLNSPADNEASLLNELQFNATASVIGATLINMSLWHNASGTFELNQTNSTIDPTTNTTTFNATFAEGTYLWGIQGCDSDGDCGFSENRTFSIDTTAPSITITNPIILQDYAKAGVNETLNWTIIEPNLNNCFYQYNNTNRTVTCTDNNVSFELASSPFNITFFANDTAGNLNSTSVNWTYKIFQNSETFNTSTFETKSELYSINITANSSLTAADLIWNGTSFAGTQSGLVWSRTIDIPTGGNVNKSFFWNFTYAGSKISSISNKVLINHTNFSICGGDGGNTKFLNISFQNEADLSQLNASIPVSNFTYHLGSGTVTKSIEFINNTNNFEYNFCATPNQTLKVLPNLQYKQGLLFPQRIWNPTVRTYENNDTNQTLYLLNTIDGIFVTFQIINSADQTLSGVDVRVVRSIAGQDFEVGSGVTSEAGIVTFFLNPDFEHTVTAAKTGFVTKTTVLFPTQSSFTITLAGGDVSANNFFKGIEYWMLPQLTFLENDTTYLFEFNVTSSFWDITNFGFNLRLKNGTVVTTQTSSVVGTPATFSYDVNNQSIIYMDAFWNIDNGNFTNITKFWSVTNTENTQWSIARFFTDLNLYINTDLFGLDDFGRYLIAFIIIFLSVGIVSFKYGLTSPLSITTLIFTITFFFDVVVGLIPTIRGIPNVLTYISGLILVLSIFREAQR